VAGRISRLERTRSFWEGHRNDVNFRGKRDTVRERFKGKDYGDIGSVLKDKNLRYDIQDVCNFYERLASGIKKGYYDEEEAKEYVKRRLINDYDNVKHYINYRRNNQQEPVTYYENFLWLEKRWRDT
jgi:Domain of unknown function (DUF4760)